MSLQWILAIFEHYRRKPCSLGRLMLKRRLMFKQGSRSFTVTLHCCTERCLTMTRARTVAWPTEDCLFTMATCCMWSTPLMRIGGWHVRCSPSVLKMKSRVLSPARRGLLHSCQCLVCSLLSCLFYFTLFFMSVCECRVEKKERSRLRNIKFPARLDTKVKVV